MINSRWNIGVEGGLRVKALDKVLAMVKNVEWCLACEIGSRL